MIDDPTRDYPYGDPTYQETRRTIIAAVNSGADAGATLAEITAAMLRIVTRAMQAAYSVGRADERRQDGGAVALAALDGMPPFPCCCTRAEGHHCPSCHGQGHVPPAVNLPIRPPRVESGDDTALMLRILP